MRGGKHPLVGDEHAGTVEHLLGATEDGCQERPVTRRRLHTAHYTLCCYAYRTPLPAFWDQK